MRKDRNQIDPSKPALIVTYGSCPGKIRPLDRELLVIGRAPACDLVLNSPEVSPVHCLIVRTATGWLLRNTNPRVGTQLNGQAVQDMRLADDDTLQIGTFSFKVHLPNNGEAPGQLPVAVAAVAAEDPQLQRLQASRERLVRLAWRMRRRLHQREPVHKAERQALAQREEELEQRTKAVDARQRECQDLLQLLEEQEAEVTAQRQALLDTAEEFAASRRQAQDDLARKTAAAEADIKTRWEQLQARQREIEQVAARPQAEAPANAAAQPANAESPELAALRAENERLRRQREEVDALRNDLQSRDDELERLRQAEAEWRELQTALADLETLRQETERLRAEVAGAANDRRERDGLRDQLRAANEEQERLRQQDASLRHDLEALRREHQAHDKAEPPTEGEGQAREEELTCLREQLEASRADLKRLRDQEAEWKQQADRPAGANADIDSDALRSENDRLHRQVIELTEGLEEKARLQARLEEQRRQFIILRDQLRAKEAELRRAQAQAAPGTPEQGDLVTAVETLLKENDEYREQLHKHAEALKDKAGLEGRVESLQAEVAALRAQAPAPGGAGDDDDAPAELPEVPTLLLRPSKYLHRENEALKARLAEQEATLQERARLQAEVVALRSKLEAQGEAPASPLSESSWHELFTTAAGTESLLKETEALRDRLAEQQKQLADAARLRQENEALRAERDRRGDQPAGPPASPQDPAALADDERQRLTAQITALQEEIVKLKEGIDEDNRAAIEEKLQREGQKLIDQRAALAQAQAKLQRDRKELDASIHTTELRLAKERVQVTREWAELNRKREEVRMEVENEKRDSIRDHLDRVRRIKEEAQAKRNAGLSPLSGSRSGERKPEPAKASE